MNLNPFRLRSIKSRLMVFTLAIFLIGIWSLAFYASRMLREDMQRVLGEQQFSKVTFAAAQINEDLDTRLRALERVASDVSPKLLADQAASQALLERSREFQNLFNGGTRITRLDGSIIATVPFSSERLAANYADRDYMIAALKEGKATIGKPVVGKILKAPVLGMAVPIRDEKAQVIGAVVGAINLGQANFLDKITESAQSKTAGYLLLVAPQQRLIVTASDKKRIMEQQPAPGINPVIDRFMSGYEGTALMTNPLGVEVLASTKRVPVANWLIVNSLPTEEAFAPLHAMQQRVVLAAILLSLLAGALIWTLTSWMLRRQLSPMIAATETLTALSESTQHPQPLPIVSQDEIGELIAGFNRLMATLAQREEALNSAQRIAKLGSWSLDLTSDKLIWSDEIYRLFEIDPHRFTASYEAFLNAIHPEDRDAVNQAYLVSLANRAPYEIVHRLLMSDGRIKWVQERCDSEFDASGKPLRSTGTMQDITERMQSEAELKRSNAELEQFSYAISHDMRQPLRMIASYLQLLDRALGAQLDSERREYLDFAKDGAKRLDQMLVGLLEYSRVGRQGEPPAWTDSRAMLDEALLFLGPAIDEAQAEIVIEGSWPRILVSPNEMLRLMQNLIANAIKFRVSGRSPVVTVTSETTHKAWRMCVADNGVGINPDQIDRLFQVFQRLQARTAYEGSGIGLALCRKIAEHHHGHIWAESAGEGRGSRFCILLPQEQAAELV